MEDSIQEAKVHKHNKYEYITLKKAEIPDYLLKCSFDKEVIDILMKDEINKKHPQKGTTPSLLKLRLGKPMNIKAFWSNDIQFCISKNLQALCEWIYIEDSTEKMINL